MCFFLTNTFFWKKNAKGGKFAVQCDWMSKISQDVRNLSFSWKKTSRFSEKNFFFQKKVGISNFAVKCDWKIQLSQSVRNLVSLIQTFGFFEKNFFKKRQ